MSIVWLADLTYTQQSISAESMPYGVACLAAYASIAHSDVEFRIFKYPEKLIKAFANDVLPSVIGFSHYVWNSELSLAFARIIRKVHPQIVIVFGGPHYSLVDSERECFLREHPYIDFYVCGEGEVVFSELLSRLKSNGYSKDRLSGQIASIHSIDSSGTAHLSMIRPRMASLVDIPPPYLQGILDEFFDGALVPTLQTNRGCPFTCTFCVEGDKYYHKIALSTLDVIKSQLDYIGSRMQSIVKNGGRNELILTDSNFGMYPQDDEICAAIADCQDKYGWPRYINATTGKNKRDRVLRAIEKTRGAIQLTGSVQSLDTQVLENIRRRNIDTSILTELALHARGTGTNTYSEIILGLPGDSREAHLSTIKKLLESGFDSITMFQLSLLPGSELATPENRKLFGMNGKFRIIPRCFGSFSILGEQISIAEIDEVCVELTTLPFEDYLDCRIQDFYVAILHNHGPFVCIEKFLKEKGLSVADWIDIARSIEPPEDLKAAIRLFVNETKTQLYDSREHLMDYISKYENVMRYISGESGNNEMYTYRAYVLMYSCPGYIELAFNALIDLFRTKNIALSTQENSFIESMKQYVAARMDGIFELDSPDCIQLYLTNDIKRYESSDAKTTFDHCCFLEPQCVYFTLTSVQRNLLKGYSRTIGLNEQGIGRALTKSRLWHFLREPSLYPLHVDLS